MLRFSDIFKKYRQEKKQIQDDGIDISTGHAKEKPENDPGQKSPVFFEKICIADAVAKELEIANVEQAHELYQELAGLAKKTYASDAVFNTDTVNQIKASLEKVVDLLNTSNHKDVLQLCLADYAVLGDHLYYHVVNVCIICVEMGVGFHFERFRLIELGIAAFLHDIGEVGLLSLINKPEMLTAEEFSQIKDHPNKGYQIVGALSKDLSLMVLDAVRQEHERMDGSGYPQGLRDAAINEYARIIGLVDVYEALTHQRLYRGKQTPVDSVKTILSNKGLFDTKAIKILIERIGMFPIGTVVKLNTQEVGIVLKGNLELPLRPTVCILLDAYGKELKQPKKIDLAENSMIYIEECVKH